MTDTTATATATPAALPARSDVPVELTWDLTQIFATDADWEDAFATVERRYPELVAFKGKLRRSGKNLLAFLNLQNELYPVWYKLHVYASMKGDEDTTNSHYQGLTKRMRQLGAKIGAAMSWVTPELLTIKPERLEQFFKSHPGLEAFRHDLEETMAARPHVRSPEVEEVLAALSPVRGGSGEAYDALCDADMVLPKVQLDNGEMKQLTQGNYGGFFLDSQNRGERQRAFEAMMGSYKGLRNTMAALYGTNVHDAVIGAKIRNWPSALEAAVGGIHLPVSVYTSLVDTVNANLPRLHRYLELRKRILGVDELHMWDLYVPLVPSVEWKVTWEQAQEMVLAAVAPLGKEYCDALRAGYASRWVDVVENKGKASGAYSGGCYGTPPYMLMNWFDSLDTAYTLGHESGHSMHSYFSRRTQPFHYAGYTLFLAEIASTCNEALMTHYLLKVETDPERRKYIINHALEGFRTTLFRQTLFAEFEMRAHALVESGKPLTADVLCALHKELNDKYYGKVCHVDQIIEDEWARIPHFYRNFYVYQYATGISAATALARQIITEGEPAVQRYLKFLSSGSSDYSINLLRAAGVDLSTPAPIQLALDEFNDLLDQFEALL